MTRLSRTTPRKDTTKSINLKQDDANTTLFVKGIPTVFSEIGPVKQCFVVQEEGQPDRNKGFGYVKFALPEDLKAALNSPPSLLGNPLHVTLAKKRLSIEHRMAKKRNASSSVEEPNVVSPLAKKLKTTNTHLIVRNLSFQCTPEKLKQVFSKFGKVVQARMPKKPSGAYLGFGTVQFEHHQDAEKALNEMNETEIEHRVVAVDWCLPKNTYLQLDSEAKKSSSTTSSSPSSNVPSLDPPTMESNVTSQVDLKVLKKEQRRARRKQLKKEKKEKKRQLKAAKDLEEQEKNMDSTPPTNDSGNTTKTKNEIKSNSKTKETATSFKTPEVSEKTTLFLRHLPVSCTKQDLLKIFKPFGSIVYISIRPSSTLHTTAFVCFSTPEAAQQCLSKVVPYEPNAVVQPELPDAYPFVVQHEVFAVHLALPKDALDHHHELNKDKRNLYLLHEIPEPALSALKLKLTKSADLMLSTTRLSFQHVPKTYTKKELKQLALKPFLAKDLRSIPLKQVVLVKSEDARNKGFGFVEFVNPKDALMCMRAFRDRSISLTALEKSVEVCFAIENRRIVGLRERRIQLSKAKKEEK